MKKLCAGLGLFVVLALIPLGLRAESATYVPRTGTVKAGPLVMSLDDVIFTPKKDYVHVIVNVFPYAARIKALGLKSHAVLANALIKEQGAKLYPDVSLFKLDVVELSQHDNYGNPRWETVVIKERFQGERKKGKLAVVRVGGEEIVK